MARSLARVMTSGPQSAEAVSDRCMLALGRRWRWVRPLARRYFETYVGQARPRRREVVRFLFADEGFGRAWAKYFGEIAIADRFVGAAEMLPVVAAKEWHVPAIRSVGEMAEWCELSVEELEWLADLNGMAGRQTGSVNLRHYNYLCSAKVSGGVRLIEAPKRRLKELQRKVLAEIVDRVSVHAAVHGFVRGRSIRTFAEPHAGQAVVLRMDLKDFFPSIRRARIQALFRTMGYPELVADLLGGMCANSVPRDAWVGFEAEVTRDVREMYRRPHLPQGAPSSPALANLCAYRMDCRLAGLAEAVGARYTRYADDLAFSGGAEFARGVGRFVDHVGAVILEEGFAVNFRKTRMMRQGVRQELAGVVVNAGANVKRDEFDRLRAILHNCVKLGPESQNRAGHADFQAHLLGAISFVAMVRPERGAKLRAIFDQIRWG